MDVNDSKFNDIVYNMICSPSTKIINAGIPSDVAIHISNSTLAKLSNAGDANKWNMACYFVSKNFSHAIWLAGNIPSGLEDTHKAMFLASLKHYCFTPSPIGWRNGVKETLRLAVTSLCVEIVEGHQIRLSNQIFGRENDFTSDFDLTPILFLITGESMFDPIFDEILKNHSKSCAFPITSLRAVNALFLSVNSNIPLKNHYLAMLGMWALRQYYISFKKENQAALDTEKLCDRLVLTLISFFEANHECLKMTDGSLLKSFTLSSLKSRFNNALGTKLLTIVIRHSEPADLSPNQIISMINTHSLFNSIITPLDSETETEIPVFHKSKATVLKLVHTIMLKNPVSCCTTQMLSFLSRHYFGSLLEGDIATLSIFRLFEERAGISVVSNITNWGKRDSEISSFQPGEALNSISSARMASTIHWFPSTLDIQIRESSINQLTSSKMNPLYDPSFILPLVACLIKDYRELIDPHRLIECNALGLAIMALSSQKLATRQAAHFIISNSYDLIDQSEVKERNQVMLLLKSLRNAIPIEKQDEISPIPSLITSFAAQALMILLKPESDMYPMINQFCLQRPILDLEDIPLFYSLFYSNTQDHRKERIWILRLLLNGLNSIEDYRIFQRRYVAEILITFFPSPLADKQMRKLIFEILFKCSAIPSVISSLVTKSGLISFLKSCCSTLVVSSELGLSLPILITRCYSGFQETPIAWDGPINRKDWIIQFKDMSSMLFDSLSDFGKSDPVRIIFASNVMALADEIFKTGSDIFIDSRYIKLILPLLIDEKVPSTKSEKRNVMDIDSLFNHITMTRFQIGDMIFNLAMSTKVITKHDMEVLNWTLKYVSLNSSACTCWLRWLLQLSLNASLFSEIEESIDGTLANVVWKLTAMLDSTDDTVCQLSRCLLLLYIRNSASKNSDSNVSKMASDTPSIDSIAHMSKLARDTPSPRHLLSSPTIVDTIKGKELGEVIKRTIGGMAVMNN